MTIQTHSGNSRDSTKWFIHFFVFSIVFFLIAQNAFFRLLVVQYYTPILVNISSKVMSIMGVGHDILQNTFVAGGEKFSISDSCTGISVFFLLCVAILSFPVKWQARLQGLIIGFCVLFLLNVFRIVLIVTIGKRFTGSFWTLHIVVGQVIVIAGTVAFFIFWLNYMTSDRFLSDALIRKKVIKQAFLFAAGYGLGLVFYDLFLKSSFGKYINLYVQEHSLVIINLFRIIFKDWLQIDQFPGIGFNIGCLSSPIMVVLMAIIVCMPWRWRTKVSVLIIGFIPVFYGYHLIRAVLTAISFALGESKDTSIIYNCYGQFFLAGLGILLFWYSEYADRQDSAFIIMGRITKGLFAGSTAAVVGGLLFVNGLLPFLISLFSSSKNTYYNFQLTISTMAFFQFFILFVLIWSNRTTTFEKIKPSIYGSAGLLIFMIVLIGLIEVLDLSPHIGILKIVIICSGSGIYFLLKK